MKIRRPKYIYYVNSFIHEQEANSLQMRSENQQNGTFNKIYFFGQTYLR